MAGALDQARVQRDSTPATIDADLEALWIDIGRDTPIARALMANLVVFCQHSRGTIVDFGDSASSMPVDEVVRRHPSRVILLHHSPSEPSASAPIAAAVAVVTFGKDHTRYGVEQISIRLASAESSLPSVVRSLVRGDVPTSIWWTDDMSQTPPARALVEMGRQIIYDSRHWTDVRRGILALAPFAAGPRAPDFADLNWRRLTVMRQALVHAAATTDATASSLADIAVTHSSGERVLAWLIAGWLASKLGDGKTPPRVRVEEHAASDELLKVSVGGIVATMTAQCVAVTSMEGAKPFQLTIRRESDADAIVAELATLARDVCLRDTVATLARFFAP